MAQIEMQGIAHSYQQNPSSESDYALSKLNIIWKDGGAYSLLGSSGCGKTTLLNIISGLLRPTEGVVRYNGKDVTHLPPEKRNIAQVFQFPVIYDTLTVYDNLAFPLRNQKMAEPEIRSRVEKVAELLDLTSDLKNPASGLTADIKQIISLGRGIVRVDVAAILLDEPLTVIDPHVKWLLRRRLKQIHEEFNHTMIFVTHDQTEALTFADEVVIVNEGKVVQQGTPEELFEKPAHTFVGYFIGSPGINLIPCKVDGNKAMIGDQSVSLPKKLAEKAGQSNKELTLGIRPEFCKLVKDKQSGSIEAKVDRVDNLGDFQLIRATTSEHRFLVRTSLENEVSINSKRWFHFPDQYLQIFADEKSVL